MNLSSSLFVFKCSFFICIIILNVARYNHVIAQIGGVVSNNSMGILSNINNIIASDNHTLVLADGLVIRYSNSSNWIYPSVFSHISNSELSVFSVKVRDKIIFTGLGSQQNINGNFIPSAGGYLLSNDRGETWTSLSFYLDEDPPNNCQTGNSDTDGCDLSFIYGGKTYQRIRFTVNEQSPPYGVDFSGDTLFSTNWASGLLRSQNNGNRWQRIFLPSSRDSVMSPKSTYQYPSLHNEEIINRYDPRSDNNLITFGLLLDHKNQLWVGTANGINRSSNAKNAPTDQIEWSHYNREFTNGNIVGNWVIRIKQDPKTKTIWFTNWPTSREEQYGLISTQNNGNTFSQHLIGYQVYDIGFDDGLIIAATSNGLFFRSSQDKIWKKQVNISDNNGIILEATEFYSVAKTENNLWIGTDNGLIATPDKGQTWIIYRVDYPLDGSHALYPKKKAVSAYAYPNPFSPIQHHQLKIKFQVQQKGNVIIRLFDREMNFIRLLDKKQLSAETFEAHWNGLDQWGRRVSNGPIFYQIITPNQNIKGTILLIH